MPQEFKSNRDLALLYEEVLVKLVTDGLASYSVGGQTFTKQNIAFYQEQYEHYKALTLAEESGNNGTRVVDMS